MYDEAEGDTPQEKINSMRREAYTNRQNQSLTENRNNSILETVKGHTELPNRVIISDEQFGKKVGKHASDFGLDPTKEEDRL